jgi:hypothetical protein
MSKIQVNEIVNHFDTGAPDCPKGLTVTGFSTFSGGVSIGGTLTYEDVTNIDSVGVVTARGGLNVGLGGTFAVLTNNGRLGLKTTSPDADIEIRNAGPSFQQYETDTDVKNRIRSNGNIFIFEASREPSGTGTHFSFRTSGATSSEERLAITDAGVGIGGTQIPRTSLDVLGGVFSNGSYEESIAGGSTIDKTVTFDQRGMFMMLISFSLGTTTSDSTRNIYSFGLFTPTSNNAVWTAINEDLVSSHVGTFTISGNSVRGQLRIQKTGGSDNRQCSFRIDVLSSTGVEITVANT